MISLKKQNKGFTIVELLIVIVVIGILAGLVITTYNGIQQKARNTERTTDLKTFQSQLEAYYAQNGRYPMIATDGTGLGGDSAQNVAFIQTNMKGMDKETLRDPKGASGDYSLNTGTTLGGNKYTYNPAPTGCDYSGTNDCTSYTLTAVPEGGGSNIV
ncbi:MAG TPA: type II secretion system protein, partial [Candidatus Saccharimonadales bacterium]|nr:type II secretion system protein [Candidatus Saccharimonadales bacterium]